MSKADKHNKGKSIFADPFRSKMFGLLSAVQTFGEKKYDRNNWRNGFNVEELLDALLGHLYSHFYLGEVYDQESKLPHLGHAAAELMFLIENTIKEDFGRNYFLENKNDI
jgi:hypothetical protein